MAFDAVTYAAAKNGAIRTSEAYTDDSIAGLGVGFSYKGSVPTIDDLPTGATKGDEYTVGDLGPYVWDGTNWKPAGVKGEIGPQGPQGPEGPRGHDGARVVTVAETGTAVDNVKYITIDGDEHKIAQPEANSTATTTAKLTKLKIDGINYALQGGGASVFANYQAMITEFNSKVASDLELGWNIYIRTIDVPDLWVSKNDEVTSVPYTYTTDAQFVADLKTAAQSGLQIGYYRVNQLEAEKVSVPVQGVTLDGQSVVTGNVAQLLSPEIVHDGMVSNSKEALSDTEAKNARQWLKTGVRITDTSDPSGDVEMIDMETMDLVEAIAATSTHNEIATAKAVYDTMTAAIAAAKPQIIYH